MKGVEECIGRRVDVGVDADSGGRQIIDYHVAVHPQNVDAVEQNLGRWGGHISVTVRGAPDSGGGVARGPAAPGIGNRESSPCAPTPGRRRQVRDENNELYYRAPRNITRDNRDVKDRVVVTTETISLCLTHLNARSAPRSGNPDVIDRVYIEHFDVDDVKKGNRRRRGSLVSGVGYAPAPRPPFPARAIEARPSESARAPPRRVARTTAPTC